MYQKLVSCTVSNENGIFRIQRLVMRTSRHKRSLDGSTVRGRTTKGGSTSPTFPITCSAPDVSMSSKEAVTKSSKQPKHHGELCWITFWGLGLLNSLLLNLSLKCLKKATMFRAPLTQRLTFSPRGDSGNISSQATTKLWICPEIKVSGFRKAICDTWTSPTRPCATSSAEGECRGNAEGSIGWPV